MGLSLKIGLGGIIEGKEVMTFDFKTGNKDKKLKPYLREVIGRAYQYGPNGLEAKFVDRDYSDFTISPYGQEMYAMTFKVRPYIVYQYCRFPSMTLGEIVEGFFVILKDEIKELELEEVMHWVGSAKEKEKTKGKGKAHFEKNFKKYAPDDIDF